MPTISFNVPADYAFSATVDGKTYPVDAATMTEAALLYVFEYGLQRAVNDRTGGKDKTAADKAKIAKEVIARLESADFTARKPREATDPVIPFIRNYLRDTVRKANGDAWKAYKAFKEAAERNDYLDAIFDKQDEKAQAAIRKLAEGEKAKADAEKARRESEAAKLAKSIELTI